MKNKPRILIVSQLGILGGEEFQILNTIEALKKDYDFKILLSEKGKFTQLLEKYEIPYRLIPLKGHYDIKAFYLIYKILKENQYDIIHIHSPRFAFYFLLINLILKRKNLLWTHHVFIGDSFPLKTLKGKLYFLGVKLLYKQAFKNIAVSDYIKQLYVLNGLKESKFIRIYNGLYFDKMHLKPIKSENIRFGIVSRQEPFKGYPVLLRMIEKYDINNFEIHIFNEGSLSNKIKNAIKNKKNIYYHGFLLNKDEIYNNFDILLLLSYFEGFGFVTVEALYYKKIILARDNALNREILYKYPDIGFIKKFDEDNLYKKMKEIAKEENIKILKDYVNNYDFSLFIMGKNIKKLKELYEEIYENRH